MLLRKYLKKKPEYIQNIGLVFIFTSLILDQFGYGIQIFDFIEGMLLGISIPLMIVGIYFTSRKLRASKDSHEANQDNN